MLFDRNHIERSVDRLLAQHGLYRPTDLLVALGRLAADELHAWKAGDGGRLADRLFGDPVVIGRELRIARDHANSLGLLPTAEDGQLREGTPAGLNDGWALIIHTRAPAPQMDLFFDGGQSNHALALAKALAAQDPVAAGEALDGLERSDPEHPLVGAGPRLIAALKDSHQDPDQAWTELESVSQLAESRLDSHAEAYLAPLWRRLAGRLAASPGASHHPSAALARVEDWSGVAEALGSEPARVSGPEQLIRGVRAHVALGDRRRALDWFFELCWRYPETAEDIERIADRTLKLDVALDRWDDLDLGREWGWQEFPSWLILGGYIPADRWQDADLGSPSFRALLAALRAPGDITARQALQQAHTGLFERFIQTRIA